MAGYRRAVRCPYCQPPDEKVVDAGRGEDGGGIRGRRECLACGRRFTTYERLEELPLMVVKRGGTREPFDRAKVEAGIQRAVTHRPVPEGAVETIAAEIEDELRAESAEVASERVGLAVLERLRVLDPVSYLRFASVYKGFEDVTDFQREVAVLQKSTEPKRHPAPSR